MSCDAPFTLLQQQIPKQAVQISQNIQIVLEFYSHCLSNYPFILWTQLCNPQFTQNYDQNKCLVHLLSQNLVRAYSNFLSMLNFLCILKIILVYSKIRFLYINWLIWVYQNCFEYTLKIWVYLKIWGHSKQILRKQMD